ncbi:ABC transporter ATP-binding protein [Maricaulis parjimensis]|uniref:ABC transporter ATP-binding protein n=1 Tax=Maricaulis parjimensis TaxID=144023 RepID=UPI00193A9ED4|nr:ABC transporter ATP-binding protein [Maricaulis parjimensis]
MTETVLRFDDVTLRYGRLTALDQVSLNVPAGAIYGFLGPNGAGKTSAIRCAMGLIRPQSGQISIGGADVFRQRRRALASVGAIIETPALFPNLTGRENLEVTRQVLGTPRARMDEVLEIVDMAHEAHRRVGQYSLGMRQRIGLARALLTRPKLLILDEPTNGLDPAGIRDMRELIRDLPQRTGATIFMSSHLLSEVEHIASHVGLLQNGRVLFNGSLKELADQQQARLIVDAEPAEQAENVLDRFAPGAWVRDGARFTLTGDCPRTPQDIAALNAALVEAGCAVSALHLEEADLESTFLTLTRSAASPQEDAA